MKEQWKDIEKTNGRYMISNKGVVVSFKSGNAKIIKPRVLGSGVKKYVCVQIQFEQTYGLRSLSKLVADHFLPNPKNYSNVITKDGNYMNVSVDNLEWMGRSVWEKTMANKVKEEFLQTK